MNIKDHMDSIKENLKMDHFIPSIKNPLNTHHSAHSTFPQPKPCLGSIVNCLYVPVMFHHNTFVGSSLIKPPCRGYKCGHSSVLKPIRKPTIFVTLKPSYPGYSETLKPPVYHYNTHPSICNSKKISQSTYLYFKCNHKNSFLPTYATVKSLTVANSVNTSAPIKSNLYPIISSTPHPEKFSTESIREQIFLPEEIYNLATNPPKVSQETHKPYGMETLKENITQLEKEILGITDEIPLLREVTDSVFLTTDKISHKEDLVTEYPTSTSRQVLYLNISKNDHDKSQSKSLATTEISIEPATNSEETLIRSIQPTETHKTTTMKVSLLDKDELSKTIQSFQTDFESITTINPLFSITSSVERVKDLGNINKSRSDEGSSDYTTLNTVEERLIQTTDSDSSKDTDFILDNTLYLDPSVPTVLADFKHEAGNPIEDNYNTTEVEQSSYSFLSDLRENFRLAADDNSVLDSDNVQNSEITPVMSNRELEVNSDAVTLPYEDGQTTELSNYKFTEQQMHRDEKYYESTPIVLSRTDDNKIETQLVTENTEQSPDYKLDQELKTDEKYDSTPLVLPRTEANNEETQLAKQDIQESSINELERELEIEEKYYESTPLVLSGTNEKEKETLLVREDVQGSSDYELGFDQQTEEKYYKLTTLALSTTDNNQVGTQFAPENVKQSSDYEPDQDLKSEEKYYESTPQYLSRTEETQLPREDNQESSLNELEQELHIEQNSFESTTPVLPRTDDIEEDAHLTSEIIQELSVNDLKQVLQLDENYYESTPLVLTRTGETQMAREDIQKSSVNELEEELEKEVTNYKLTPLVESTIQNTDNETQIAREDIQESLVNELKQELHTEQNSFESTTPVLPWTDDNKEETKLANENIQESSVNDLKQVIQIDENYYESTPLVLTRTVETQMAREDIQESSVNELEEALEKEETYYESTPLVLSGADDIDKETLLVREDVQGSSDYELELDQQTEEKYYESTTLALSTTDNNQVETQLSPENVKQSSDYESDQELKTEEKYYESTPQYLSRTEETQLPREDNQESSLNELEQELDTEQNSFESTTPVLPKTDDSKEGTKLSSENIQESSVNDLKQVLQIDENYYESTPLVITSTEETQMAREDVQESTVNELEQELHTEQTSFESTTPFLPRTDDIEEYAQLTSEIVQELSVNDLKQVLEVDENYYESTPLVLTRTEETQMAREDIQEPTVNELEQELHTEQNSFEPTTSVLPWTDDNKEETKLASENIQESSVNDLKQVVQIDENYYESTPLVLTRTEETQMAREDIQESTVNKLEQELEKDYESTPLVISTIQNTDNKTQMAREDIQKSLVNELEQEFQTEISYYETLPLNVSNFSTQAQNGLTIIVSTTPTNAQDLNLQEYTEDTVISEEGREIISQSHVAEETSEKLHEIDLVVKNKVDISSKTGRENSEVLINNWKNNLDVVTGSTENWVSTESTTYGYDQSSNESSTSYFIHTLKSNDNGVRFESEVESSTDDHSILFVNEEVPYYDTDDEIDPITEKNHYDHRVKRSLVVNETSGSVINREKVLNFTHEMSGKLKNTFKGVEEYNNERSHASVILELLPLIREGYKNNAFNEHDKKAISSIFGDIKSLKDGKSLPVVTDLSRDMFMGDETSRSDDVSDYSDDEYEQEQDRLKRSKDVKMVSDRIRKFPSRVKRTISSPFLQQNVRKIRSAGPQKVSEAAAILALLAEEGGAVQLDSPDDYDDDDSYEYYEDEEEDLYSDDKDDDDDDDDDQFYDDYGDASFTELIRLAKKHRERKAKEQ
ncbi:hypothetical protein J6590_011466 [Homalodisca vitripennis]|nr:hypothetical protein J6590_011466 [Homalodisca vitripennis]